MQRCIQPMPSQSRTDAAATPVTTLTTGSAPAIDKSGGRDPSAPGRCPMILRFALRSVLPGLLLYTLCAPPPARANPAPGPLRFIAPTPVAGSVPVRLRATKTEQLQASAMDNGNVVTGQLAFAAGDPTPDQRQVVVAMPPDLDFVNYESSHVHPLAVSGSQLYAVNTPDGRLAIFTIAADGSLALAGNVPVGLDPVSLAVRPGTNEVWVVNHLSDSVSVVDVAARKVLATLVVGDEPTDVAFASGRAFVTLAGNQDRVNVYDAATRAQLASIALFGDDPRALAVNAA